LIAKEIEISGYPVVQVTNMEIVANSVGIKRQCFSPSIVYPLGNPNVPLEEEKAERLSLTKEAVDKLLK
jgi:glycine reductase